MPDRCAISGALDDLQEHHLAGKQNNATAKLWLRKDLHDEQSARQWQLGVLTRLKRPPSEVRTLHAVTEGVAGILGAHARHIGSAELAAYNERFRRASVELVGLLCEERLGPRPILNDRPHWRARRPRPGPNVDLAESGAVLAAELFPALADAVTALIPDSAEADIASRVAAGAQRVAAGLAALDGHPRSRELRAATEHASASAVTAMQRLAESIAARELEPQTAPEDAVELARDVQAFARHARAHREFMLALAADEDPAIALDRLLAAQASPDRGADEGAGG
jgi:hypothetical protein